MEDLFPDVDSREQFLDEDRRVTIRNVGILCAIAIVLVPAAVILDCFAYRELLVEFSILRIACAIVLFGVYLSLRTSFAKRHYRAYTIAVPVVPAFFISLMIAIARDPGSPYYAGLTLCLVAIGFMFHWTYREALIATLLVLGMYVAASVPWLFDSTEKQIGMALSNIIFILLNGVVIVCGSYFHHRVRVQEFIARRQLDHSRDDLEASNKQLRELDQLKNDFIANVSHELRTPLTLLLAPLQSLRRHKVLPPNQAVMVDNMHQQALRLLKLINDLLDIARLESGQLDLHYERISIRKFVDQLTESISELAKQRNITVTALIDESADTVDADRDKLEKICLNLLFNATKFTPDFGRIRLRVSARQDIVEMVISDTGVGIPKKRLPFIFDRFWQEDSSTKRKHHGTGIGLALVKELIEAHGGSVRADSAPNQGTTMTILLPRENAAVVRLPDEGGEAKLPSKLTRPEDTEPRELGQSTDWLIDLYREAEFSPAHTGPVPIDQTDTISDLVSVSGASESNQAAPIIVVADDEEGMRSFLAGELLQRYQIVEAYNGRDALRKVKEWKPDLLLLDYMMPEMDGFEVCAKLRQDPDTRMIPIMLLSAKADEQSRLQGLKVGANDMLVKPFSLVEFHTRVKNLLRTRKLQKDLEDGKAQIEETLVQLQDTESQLVQSEKFAAVGQLSAGILHEINNPLHYSVTALYTLSKMLTKLPEPERSRCMEAVADLEEGFSRVTTIVSDLRDFTHPDTGSRAAVDLAEVITVASRMLAPRFKEDDISFEIELEEEPIALFANRNRLIQVFINLIQNACDAVVGLERRRIEIRGWIQEDRQSASVAIHDTGRGISREHLNKLYDPFFTTKEVGKGTGLGLSICYRLIEEHGGKISVESEPGLYTQFTLALPLAEPQIQRLQEATVAESPS